MTDQADTLRRLMQEKAELDRQAGKGSAELRDARADFGGGVRDVLDAPGARVVTVASGKGGVGKSVLVANLGATLARQGFRVLLVDADFGLANLDIILGVQSSVTLEEVLDGKAPLQSAIVGVEPNLWLLPAGAGLHDLRRCDGTTRGRMIALFERCPWEMDFILIDAGAGIQDHVLSVHHPAYESIVLMTPDPTSLTDAYSLVKLVRRHAGVGQFSVVVNQVTDAREGRVVFQRLRDVADKFMTAQFDYLGNLPRDEKITQSVLKRKILLDLDAGAPAVPCLELLAKRLAGKLSGKVAARSPGPGLGRMGTAARFRDEPAPRAPGNTAKFWRTLLGEVKA